MAGLVPSFVGCLCSRLADARIPQARRNLDFLCRCEIVLWI